jgi:hypothetical protein
MLHDLQVHDLTVRLFKLETERDKQKKVGASQISDPCSYHLAKALIGAPETPSKYWLGGKIGTAVHSFIEESIDKADIADFPELEGCVVEQKINLGELPEYGTINSKPDLMLVKHDHLIDWKTSSRDKMKKMRRVLDALENGEPVKDSGSYATLMKYVAQMQLYAWGLNRGGTPVDGCSLVFINRDGTTEADIWTHTFDYSEEFALAIWGRLENLWGQIQSGVDLESIEKDADCFKCAMGI